MGFVCFFHNEGNIKENILWKKIYFLYLHGQSSPTSKRRGGKKIEMHCHLQELTLRRNILLGDNSIGSLVFFACLKSRESECL